MTTGFGARVTALVLTYNELPNIERMLERLHWVRRIVVVDSGSDDGTLEALTRHPRVEVFHRTFDNHANQANFALTETGIDTDWVLALDADFILTEELVAEMAALEPPADVAGYVTHFVYCIGGHRLRGTLYPSLTTLFRRAAGRYEQTGHAHRLRLDGRAAPLQGRVLHDDRKSLSRWLWSQDLYAGMEVRRLMAPGSGPRRLQDRLRSLLVVTPWLMPLYCLTVKRGLLDGLPGLCYALQRGVAEAIIAMKLIEARLGKQGT